MSSDLASQYPRIVIFLLDATSGFPAAQDLRGNIHPSITIYLVLAFYFSDRAAYAAEKWQNYQQKQQYVDDLHKQNIKIMVSVGGGDVKPTTDKWVPADAANNVAQFVKQNALDGVDLDWEDSQAYALDGQQCLDWIVNYTQVLRNNLGNEYIISHSPASAYFCPTFPSVRPTFQGLYFKVDHKIGSLIDFYNVMFYDSSPGGHDYETVQNLVEESTSNLPRSALLEIAANSEYTSDINKLVIGKPVLSSDQMAGGYMSGDLIAQSVQDAMTKSPWKAGIMGWQYHVATSFHTFADPSAKALAGK
ncbi:glycoside hydrolase [Tricholoma matsutake]|nr:glycoside hydrolase [Tricholoma matsutake 945]